MTVKEITLLESLEKARTSIEERQITVKNKLEFLALKICEYAVDLNIKLWKNTNEYSGYNPKNLYDEPEALTMDAIASGYIGQWFKDRIKDGCSIIVVSVGSCGSEEQCYPSFVKDQQNVAVLNIDKTFAMQTFVDTSNLNVVKMRFGMDKSQCPKAYSSLIFAMLKTLELGKKVILIDFTSPLGFEKFSNSILRFGSFFDYPNFAYIQSYFDYLPTAILNKEFFVDYEKNGIQWATDEVLNKIWKIPEVKQIDLTKSMFTQSEIDQNADQNNLAIYGKFFNGLKSIQFKVIFERG